MTELVTNRILVRGKEYLVRELNGREMAGVRGLLEKDKPRISAYVASVACIDPKLGTEKECFELPHRLIDAIATESIRLTNADDEGEEAAKKG